jgi:hypothetical protein
VRWLTHDESWPAGWATLAILMLLSLAVNSIFLGIIGEYLARVYSQVKPQPLTIVERFIDRAEPAARERRAIQSVAGIVLPTGDAGVDRVETSSDEL